MKKKIVLAMAIIMVLGSVKAMAEEMDSEQFYQDEIYQQLQWDKTLAAEADSKERAQSNREISQLDQLSNEIETKLAKISGLKDSSQPNLNKAIKSTVQQAKGLHREFKASHDIQKLQKLSADLEDRWQSLNEMDEKNQIQGLRVHPELRY
ncbi:hypothetical protein [Bdellovibrio bacteriovorus]|uniref:hypothetical protein n=1 Tax=Bdellovibrio bacteriovorus TaxID=959 RepID=UPI0035A70AAB